MADLKPPSDDGSLLVVYQSAAGPFGPSEYFEKVVGYEGEQRLTVVHFEDGTTVECHNTLFVRTWTKPSDE